MPTAGRYNRITLAILALFIVAVIALLQIRKESSASPSAPIAGPAPNMSARIVPVVPTSTPTPCEQALRAANIDPLGYYTLGDLVQKLGPPDDVRTYLFSPHDARIGATFYYLGQRLYFNTGYQRERVKPHIPVQSCESIGQAQLASGRIGEGFEWTGFEAFNR